MNSSQLHDLFRGFVRDQDDPKLWSDAEVAYYMNDAQSMFCRLQGGIADSNSTPLTQLLVDEGDVFVSIDPKILKIRRVVRDDYKELRVLNFEELQGPGTGNGTRDYGQWRSYRLDNTVGPIEAVVTGMEQNMIRLINIPDRDQVLQLTVYRMPLVDITEAFAEEFEIDPQHHYHLLKWMCHLAYAKQDAETYDRGRSEEFRQQFLEYCDQAKADREKLEHTYRTVAYGGI